MKTLKILRYDIKYGILKKYAYYICGILIAAVSCLELNNRISLLKRDVNIKGSGAFIDYWIYLIQGKEPYTFSIGEFYEFPKIWILIFGFYLISTCMHPHSDLSGIGGQYIIRSRSREKWWISKTLWILLSSVCYFAAILLSVVIISLLFKIPIRITPSWYVMEQFGRNGFLDCGMGKLFILVLLQPVLLASALGMLQMVLMLKLHPLLSFSLCFSLLIISTYHRNYFLLGNLGMPFRMDEIMQPGLSSGVSIMILLFVFVLCFCIGLKIMQGKDIL